MPSHRSGMTLIELLVVMAIVAVLLGVLLPALASTRDAAKQVSCLGNAQQLLVGVYAYTADHDGRIPAGSADAFPLRPGTRWAQNISNWVWVVPPTAPAPMHNAHGVLLDHDYLTENSAMFCPGTDSPDYYNVELDKYRSLNTDIYSAYLYRQLDQVEGPYIEALGHNADGEPAVALFADANSELPPPTTQHGARVATVGYVNGSARVVDNSAGWLTARESDYVSLAALLDRLSVMLRAMDASAETDLDDWSP